MTAFSPSMSQRIIKSSRRFIFKAIGVAIAWTLLFKLNMWLFKSLEVNQFVSWVFLPAFIRILSVLLFGWAAVVGLIVGAIITSNPADAYHTTPYVLAMISWRWLNDCGSILRIRAETPAHFDWNTS